MAIQTVNLAVPNGDTPRSANTKINANFSDQTNAASRLVGKAAGNVMEVGAFGLGSDSKKNYNNYILDASVDELAKTQMVSSGNYDALGYPIGIGWSAGSNMAYTIVGSALTATLYLMTSNNRTSAPSSAERLASQKVGTFLVLGFNASQDSNGFLKGASPVIDMYDNKIDLNQDAEQQGGITFEKLGVGDYLVKGSLGFAQEGWHIETPKDTNGNVLVAVVETQLENNDLSIKTYAKRFDDETGDIVANLAKPRDIPTGRFISLRLHELPKEPPVMPLGV